VLLLFLLVVAVAVVLALLVLVVLVEILTVLTEQRGNMPIKVVLVALAVITEQGLAQGEMLIQEEVGV
tara:strand:- start:46 stop:249 length:204 start_codon:yes stop_codon:yes gene_type:complete